MASTSQAADMDRLAALPFEIRKRILNELNNRRDVFNLCSQSPQMLRTSQPLHKQFLETELGVEVIAKVFPDALAVTMFPVINREASEKTQREVVRRHLKNWRNKDLADRCTEAHKTAAAYFLDETVTLFVEDFAAKARSLDGDDSQLWFPLWVNEERRTAAPIYVDSVREYRPSERIRLFRAFCRFQMLSMIVQARSGRQIWSMSQQKELLETFFDAWEVEEVLCIHQYVGDLHTLLWIKHLNYITAAIDKASLEWHTHWCQRETGSASEALDRSLALRYDPSNAKTTDHFRSLFHVATAGQITTVRKLEFVDVWAQSMFLKHISTFGLGFLKLFLLENESSYKHWIRTHGDFILGKIAHPGKAAHLGADSDWVWIGDLVPVDSDDNGNDTSDEDDETDDPPTNLGKDPGVREDEANLAWKLLKKASQTSRYGFRRCGWVFWDEERLRELRFWNTTRDIDEESLTRDLAWAAERHGALDDDDTDHSSIPEQDEVSPAQKKLFRLAQEKIDAVKAIWASGLDDDEDDDEETEYHPLSFLHGARMFPSAWELIIHHGI